MTVAVNPTSNKIILLNVLSEIYLAENEFKEVIKNPSTLTEITILSDLGNKETGNLIETYDIEPTDCSLDSLVQKGGLLSFHMF